MADSSPVGPVSNTPPPASRPDMRFPLLPAAGVFVAAAVIYFACFGALEHLRNKTGPWTLEFATDPAGAPSLTIHQSALGIHGVQLIFVGEQHTNLGTRVQLKLDRPLIPLPFGQRISEDLMFLPGTEAIQLFGHEIELAPRTLVVNRKEVAWQSNQVIRLTAAEKLSPELLKPPNPKKRPIL